MNSVKEVISDLQKKKAEIDGAIQNLLDLYPGVMNGETRKLRLQAIPVVDKGLRPAGSNAVEDLVKGAGREGILRMKVTRKLYYRFKDRVTPVIKHLIKTGVIKQELKPGLGSLARPVLIHKDFFGPQKMPKVTGMVIEKRRRSKRMVGDKPKFTIEEMLRQSLEPGIRYNSVAAVNRIKDKFAYKLKRQSVLAEMNALMHRGQMHRLEKGMYYFPEIRQEATE